MTPLVSTVIPPCSTINPLTSRTYWQAVAPLGAGVVQRVARVASAAALPLSCSCRLALGCVDM